MLTAHRGQLVTWRAVFSRFRTNVSLCVGRPFAFGNTLVGGKSNGLGGCCHFQLVPFSLHTVLYPVAQM